MDWRRALAAVILLAVILIAVAAGYGTWVMKRWVDSPLPIRENGVTVEIPPGISFRRVVALLAEAGVIDHRWRLEWLGRWRQLTDRVQAGEYELAPNQTPDELLALLVEGRVKQYPFTVPEGLTCREIAIRFAEAAFGTRDEFLAACQDPVLVARVGAPTASLEGYLLPETYHLHRGMTARQLVARMAAAMDRVWTDERQDAATDLGLSRHQVLTLASVIEKETGRAEERPLISAVFHNRLAGHMRLQSDPTVIYGIENFDGNLTRLHLETDTPYNTYTRHGLPPGPIANPGQAAIDAALQPAESPTLYFVSRNDGSHHFSTTLEEHERAVTRFQRTKQGRDRR